MTKRSGSRKRKRRKSSKGKKVFWLCLGLVVLSVLNLILLDTLVSFKFGRHFLPRLIYAPVVSIFTPKPKRPAKTLDEEREVKKPKPSVPETPPEFELKPPKPPESIPKEAVSHKPWVSIVIDDLGYNAELAERLFRIDLPFTVSVLPNLPYTRSIARRAIQKGKEVILHLPMEPYDYPNAMVEEGTLLVSMKDKEIRRLISKALRGLDCAVGANNHMGSRMVEDEEKMRVILEEMQKRGLFFLDSRTSPRSIVYDLARSMGVRTGQRHVFLDGQNDIAYIRKQLDRVAEMATENGYGIAIGHLQPATIEALHRYLPDLSRKGIEFVKLSEVMK